MSQTFSDYQSKRSSEKIVLAKIQASLRLVGWTLHSGSVYKFENLSGKIIESVEEDGASLLSVGSIGAVTAGKYYYDLSSSTLYLRTTGSVNPNGVFIAFTEWLFFSNRPVNAPYDLSSGSVVEWIPLIKDASEFGSELDSKDQLGVGIEGSGTLSFYNDQDYWKPKYDKITFENKLVLIYSWSTIIPITEAKLIYRGRIQSKSYTSTQIQFGLKDIINELRSFPDLDTLGNYVGARIPDSMLLAKQRLLYGYVYGLKPTNIDEILDGYPITGTVVSTSGSPTITGSGTSFLLELNPDDKIIIDGGDTLTVETVDSNTQLTMSENCSSTVSGATVTVVPSKPRRYMNRHFLLSGHALTEPSTTVVSSSTPRVFDVVSVQDIQAGDVLLVNGETASVQSVNGNTISLVTNLVTPPNPSDVVTRLSISSLKLDNLALTYSRDFTYSATNGTLTLDSLAEFNVTKARNLTGTIDFISGSRDVTGSGSVFTKQLESGDWVKLTVESDWFEVLHVVDDITLKLKSNSSYTGSGPADYKAPAIYEEGTSILVCDLIGKSDDGTSGGSLLKTCPNIVMDLLESAGLSSEIDTGSFTDAEDIVPQQLGFSVPPNASDTSSSDFKTLISNCCRSVFSALIQNEDFDLEFTVLRPRRSVAIATKLDHTDSLSFQVQSQSDRIVKTANVMYKRREADSISGEEVFSSASALSKNGQYLSKVDRTYETTSLVVNDSDAQLLADRWAFFFDTSVSIVVIKTKLQGSLLSINDVIDFDHPNMYERIASTGTRKLMAVEIIKKDEGGATLSMIDFANAFSRVCVVMDGSANSYDDSTSDEKFHNGFITDQYGMIDGDPDTFGTNLIW